MKKRRVFAILMAVLFVGLTLNVFSTDEGTSQGQVTGHDIQAISSSDVNGVFVPE
jgi:hypothetical protein